MNATLTGFDGFYVAAAITGYDGDPNPIEDPTIGTLKMYLKTWNVYDEENGGLSFHEIPLRPCQQSDFDKSPESPFFEPKESSLRDLSIYGGKLKCPQLD